MRRLQLMRVISPISFVLTLLSISSLLFSQGTVLGTVTDQRRGEPLPGANILIEGVGIGTTSEIDGSFEIVNVPEGSQSVVVSYIGYNSMTQNISVLSGESVSIDFSLKSSPLALNEVFVTGNAGGISK